MSTEITSLNGYPLKDETARKLAEEIVVPTKLSELSEDASHRLTTDDEKAAWNAKSNFSGSYNDLTDKPTIPTVPEKVSAFENDAGYLNAVPAEYVTETELNAKGYLTEHQDISHKLDATALPAAVEDALAQAKASGEFDGEKGEKGLNWCGEWSDAEIYYDDDVVQFNGSAYVAATGGTTSIPDGVSPTDSPASWQLLASKGADGHRGTGLLPITTTPTAYTTAVNGLTPAYRIALSTVKTQAGVSDVYVGDTVRHSYYHYPVIYVDSSYVYCTTRVSIRGATGKAGTTPVKGEDYFTDADKEEFLNDMDAVRYVEQNLTPEQKATTRENIGIPYELIGSGLEEATYTPELSGFIEVSTGAINTQDKTYHTDYVELAGYTKIYAMYKLNYRGYAVAFFDASKTLLSDISIVGVGVSSYNYIEMDVPETAAYCILSTYDDSNPPNAFITLIPVKGVIERVMDLEVTTNPLHGKTIAVLGDSISSVAYTVPNYWQLIAEKTGCKFLDYCVSGSCIAKGSTSSALSFVERAPNMSASADAVLVMGGTNDWGKGVLLGEWASTDNTTLYGALNELITLLRTKYSGKPIIFCTPIKSKNELDSGFPKAMVDLKTCGASTDLEPWHCVLAIQAKCAVNGIPVIDLYNASGIGSGQAAYFRSNDNLHPSELGECRIANMVQPVLEHQFLYVLAYKNLVPTSIDTDGSIFNSSGYLDGYNLNSSGTAAVKTGYTVTGFIPATASDTIRMSGVTWGNTSNAKIFFYDSAFKPLGGYTGDGYVGYNNYLPDTTKQESVLADKSLQSVTTKDGVSTFNMTYHNADYDNTTGMGTIASSHIAYIRIGAEGSGASMIVTINQEIT